MSNQRLLFLVVTALLCSAGCASTRQGAAHTGQVHHVVLCWLKNSGDAYARAKLVSASKSLASVPGVTGLHVGTVVPSDRKIVDSSFDVGMVFSFDSADAMRSYLVHPRHVEATETVLKPLVSRIVVYDFAE